MLNEGYDYIIDKTKEKNIQMKDRKTSVKNKQTFCIFNGECDFKKMIFEKKSSQPKTWYAICVWKGHCNQQIDNPKQDSKISAALLLCH
jgi:hypothetical protein